MCMKILLGTQILNAKQIYLHQPVDNTEQNNKN